ncbi:2-succinyl-5-enolpyruvyl-6-hydroxy-3-cyclohexene-1-carboxylic-acid synthase [Phormidium tenue]|uniref:2-succinyl-5-enolpyruvyl-6-hydroxy-3-cyclohexene-1-carboxylate synthase n=1 Tax=Phormidium tenue NIES-30 TaxID=549789 RepID=A0A1U7J1D8_9CYAN|nr:2-succinyl-5-enolpyruvyl-6-hydroxy-3-cyclohexene-1-carboxylic-acid synthase [Phormidium tenue]MBD2233904.1 2-succinyl-5-enolpyruvyl-6-hydroxy-3-cyclohexene-1-carboxylic-acid synthase [Phormidium tenue FACHB-1052]OKH45692.1 2-succinyl-5-enolpyruvyl-6-hydroxy-3-cyclohexene-1-carboxylic-acid synthase [Phormidium tenue NIES-30]
MTFDFRNTNALWASVLVATLARLGLKTAVISPGSRSTPLTVALVSHPEIEAVPVLDERSAAFFALGLARRTGQPVALVCTSGTAGANYYPAVIEARESRIPLLVLTADRPPELRDCASGQTIDQQRLFGTFPNWYAELAVPVAELGMLRYLRQILGQAWGRSLYPVAGPVHLNCPFRDPLAPIADGSVTHLKDELSDDFLAAVGVPAHEEVSTLGIALPWLETWRTCDRGLIIAGPVQPVDPLGYCKAVAALADYLGWPVLAEGLSPLRNAAGLNASLVTTYDLALRQPIWAKDLVPEQVIQLGPLPTSKRLRQWLQTAQPRRWVVDPGNTNLDPLHGPVTPLSLSVTTLAQVLPPVSEARLPGCYHDQWLVLEAGLRQQLDRALADLDQLFEGKIPWLLARSLPKETAVVIANSMSIRDVEWFWPPGDRALRPYCNRGANGIDGTLSTALGIAHGGPPAVLLTGDLALLHDTNGWLSVPRLRGHLTVVVVNNQGGGIFDQLPVATLPVPGERWFEDFFTTPQTVDLNRLCAAYGVNYERVETWSQLTASVSSLPTTGVRLLEVRCDRTQSHNLRQQLLTPPEALSNLLNQNP